MGVARQTSKTAAQVLYSLYYLPQVRFSIGDQLLHIAIELIIYPSPIIVSILAFCNVSDQVPLEVTVTWPLMRKPSIMCWERIWDTSQNRPCNMIFLHRWKERIISPILGCYTYWVMAWKNYGCSFTVRVDSIDSECSCQQSADIALKTCQVLQYSRRGIIRKPIFFTTGRHCWQNEQERALAMLWAEWRT